MLQHVILIFHFLVLLFYFLVLLFHFINLLKHFLVLNHRPLEIRVRKYFPELLACLPLHLLIKPPLVKCTQEYTQNACQDQQTSNICQHILDGLSLVSHNCHCVVYWDTSLINLWDKVVILNHRTYQNMLFERLIRAVKERGPNSVIIDNMQNRDFQYLIHNLFSFKCQCWLFMYQIIRIEEGLIKIYHCIRYNNFE